MTPVEITGCFPCYQKVNMSFYLLPGFKLSTFSSRAYSQLYYIVHNLMILKFPQLVLPEGPHQHLYVDVMLWNNISPSEGKWKHLKLMCRKFRSFFFINFPKYNMSSVLWKMTVDLYAQTETPGSGHIFK